MTKESATLVEAAFHIQIEYAQQKAKNARPVIAWITLQMYAEMGGSNSGTTSGFHGVMTNAASSHLDKQ